MAHIHSSDDLIYHYQRNSSGHFFDKDTMRFFGCRVLSEVYNSPDGLVYFVTSERDRHGAWDYRRRYTVRAYSPENQNITEPQENGFGADTSRTGAIAAAKRFAAGEAWSNKYTTPETIKDRN